MPVSSGSLVADTPRLPASPRRMAAVVLNHRTADDTCLAVSSLMASHRCPDHLIVVDNDETDDCRVGLARCAPEATYLLTGRNLGFSGGMNAGIRAALDAGADLLLLVNSDIVVSQDCLGRLESALAGPDGVGIAGPLVLSRNRPETISSAGIAYNRRTGRMRVLGVGARADEAGPADRPVDAVSGCLMLVTRSVIEATGAFDERYFFGFEDLDLCLRAKDAGFSTLVAVRAVAYHEGGRTIGPTSSRRFYFGARNHLLVASRPGPGEWRGARACRLSWVAALNLAHAATGGTSSLPARLAATTRGVRDHLRGRYGADPVA